MPTLEREELSVVDFVSQIGEMAMDEQWDRVAVAVIVLSVICKSGRARLEQPALICAYVDGAGGLRYSLNDNALTGRR